MLDWGSLVAQAQEPNQFMYLVDKLARAPLSKVLLFAAVWTVLRLVVFPIIKKTKPHEVTGGTKFLVILNEVGDALVYAAIVIFMLVRPFVIQTFWVPTGSMIDTLLPNDLIVADKFSYRFGDPKVGDVVVFKPPKEALNPGQSETDFVKRLIGAPGDVIEIRDKIVYRNDKAVDEPYVEYTNYLTPDGSRFEIIPRDRWEQVSIEDFKLVEYKGQHIPVRITQNLLGEPDISIPGKYDFSQEDLEAIKQLPPAPVPAGHYFFMGDNRNGSSDGRFWGLVKRESVIGKGWFVWFPLQRIKGLG